MDTIPTSQNHLAELLGIAPSTCCLQVKRGMPTHSVAAAQAWRESHLDPSRRKGLKYDKNYVPPHLRQPRPGAAARQEATPDASAAEASALMDAAAALLHQRGDLDGLAPTLRAALRAVPAAARAEVGLNLPVMQMLAGHVLQQLPERSANPLCSDGSPIWQPENLPLSDDEAAEVGRFWYAVAAGEIQFDAAIVL
jgi:hypothetical protein